MYHEIPCCQRRKFGLSKMTSKRALFAFDLILTKTGEGHTGIQFITMQDQISFQN